MLFGPKGVVAERVEADCGRLVCVEGLGNGRPICLVLLLDDFTELMGESQLTDKKIAAREL